MKKCDADQWKSPVCTGAFGKNKDSKQRKIGKMISENTATVKHKIQPLGIFPPLASMITPTRLIVDMAEGGRE